VSQFSLILHGSCQPDVYQYVLTSFSKRLTQSASCVCWVLAATCSGILRSSDGRVSWWV